MRCAPPMVGVLTAVLAGVLAGCAGAGNAEANGSAAAGDVVELNEGGDCEGRDVLINRDGVGVVLAGECGTVTIEANGVRVDVERSDAVIVAGQDISVTGRETGALTVSGRSNSTTVDSAGSVEIRGNVVSVTGKRAEQLKVTGSGNLVAVDEVASIGVEGNDNHVIGSAFAALELTGSNNSVDWSSGVARPGRNTGSDNKITGPVDGA
ncbi:DUF3060 domain-containing protein [Rhodococcus sp. NPDC058521]|uniref:DUF3060 domain-containing protein n=1 Tax=Rhodococcus sp. NPDC058521 TaxID=3346536 RepID=UPI00365802DF